MKDMSNATQIAIVPNMGMVNMNTNKVSVLFNNSFLRTVIPAKIKMDSEPSKKYILHIHIPINTEYLDVVKKCLVKLFSDNICQINYVHYNIVSSDYNTNYTKFGEKLLDSANSGGTMGAKEFIKRSDIIISEVLIKDKNKSDDALLFYTQQNENELTIKEYLKIMPNIEKYIGSFGDILDLEKLDKQSDDLYIKALIGDKNYLIFDHEDTKNIESFNEFLIVNIKNKFDTILITNPLGIPDADVINNLHKVMNVIGTDIKHNINFVILSEMDNVILHSLIYKMSKLKNCFYSSYHKRGLLFRIINYKYFNKS